MLKFLDFARLVGAGIKCPACDGTRCRQSKWRSKHERLGLQGFRPFRCDDCENRFYAASSASLERTLVNGVAYALLGLAMMAAIQFWMQRSDDALAERLRLATTDDAEESAPVRPPPAEVKPPADAVVEAGKERPEAAESNVKLLHKAATDGHPGAMVRLGRILATGENYPKDPKMAAKWLQLAASAGSPEGMYELGRLYRDGVGLDANPARAYLWFSRAAAARHVEAVRERDKLVRTMSEQSLEEAHALALTEDLPGEIGNRK